MDKRNFDEQVFEELRSEKFFKLRNDPLPKSIKCVEKVLHECKPIIPNLARRTMFNTTLPRIGCQPKICKPGKEMREIIADSNSFTFNIVS